MSGLEGNVRSLLASQEQSLRASWESSAATFSARLTGRLTSPELFDQVRYLLHELLVLVDRPASSIETGDEQVKSILARLRALQDQDGFGSVELAFLLFSARDILRETLVALAHDEPALATGGDVSHTLGQVSTLLHRLGVVLFESDVNARQHEGFDQGGLVMEYALLYERARQMAITDQLTGLHNFGYFLDRLREEKARAERYQRLLSLVIFDIDHFKNYNDTHGHPAGNEVLKTIARILQAEAREVDIVARYGGEEMVIILPESTRRDATAMAERVRHRVYETTFANMDSQPLHRISLSAGVATFPVDAWDEHELVERADESMYLAKKSGRNRVVWYQPPHHETLIFKPDREVESVALVGNFNNWDKDYDFMYPCEDGSYRFVIALNRGVYQYKFVIDGSEWIPDPACPERCPDTLGGENSVLRVSI